MTRKGLLREDGAALVVLCPLAKFYGRAIVE
jgi:hypothetical protein